MQKDGASLLFYDVGSQVPSELVSNLAFLDYDIRKGFLNGTVTFNEPADAANIRMVCVMLSHPNTLNRWQAMEAFLRDSRMSSFLINVFFSQQCPA